MIVVTGAGGFIGRHVVRALAERGRQVRAMVYRRKKSPGLAATTAAGLFDGLPGVEVVEANVTDVESLPMVMRGATQVIHLVGIILPAHGASFEKIHFKGTANVIEAARQAKVERIIFMSGLGAGAKARSRYGRSKWQAEEALRSSGMDFAIVRPSMVFGPGDHFVTRFLDLTKRAPLIALPGGGHTRMQPVWAADLAAIVAQLAERESLGGAMVQVGGSQELTLKQAIRAILAAAGRKRPLVSLPYWLMNGIAYACEKTLRHPPVTRDQVAMLRQDSYTCDITPLVEEFGIDLLSFEKGLEIMFEKKS